MLKQIFEAITPNNIKTDPLYASAITLFIEALEEHSKYSININDVFTSDDPEIRLQFIKTFFNAFYEIMKGLSDGLNGTSGMVLPNIEDVLTNEYLYMSKYFKESKGTPQSIRYIYMLIERLLASYLDPERAPFKFTDEGIPFYFSVEGALSKELYDKLVRPLAHPLGFAYLYTQIQLFNLHDDFNIQWLYDVELIEIRCPSGEVLSFDPISVRDIDDSELGIKNNPTRIFYLNNGTYLKQTSYPILKIVQFNNDDTIYRTFDDGCYIYAIYLKYFKLLTTDSVNFLIDQEANEERFFEYVDCKIIGSNLINTFDICSGKYTAEEHFNVDLDLDFRRPFSYFKRFTEALLPSETLYTPQDEWEKIFGKVCYQDLVDSNPNAEYKSFNPLLLDSNEKCTRAETVNEQAGVGKFVIGGQATSIIDYNHLWENIRGSYGNKPEISSELVVQHFVIGGFDLLPVENYPVFEDRVTRKQQEFTTDLWDLQEFTTEVFDIQDWVTLTENYILPIEMFGTILDMSKAENFGDTNEIAKIAQPQLLVGDFNVNGKRVRSIVEEFLIETF